MSSSTFHETFSKDRVKEPLLTYDTSAFLFFLAAVVGTISLPLIYHNVISPVLKLKAAARTLVKCHCSGCNQKREKNTKNAPIVTVSRLGTFFLVLCFIAIAYSLRGKTLEIESFDPYGILEIDTSLYDLDGEGIPARDIRKQYRQLSLKYHPDRNNNDPATSAHFLLINKAHQSLTDPEAKKNFEAYGNPDGPSSMKVGIGLPRFLIHEENQILILCVFFLMLLVVIPTCLMWFYRKHFQYSAGGTLYKTLTFLAYTMDESKRYTGLFEILASVSEMRNLQYFPAICQNEEEKALQIIREALPEANRKDFKVPRAGRNYYLLMAHVFRRHDLLSPQSKDMLNQLLRISLPVTTSMFELCVVREWLCTADAVLELRRSLIQATDSKQQFLLQMPHWSVNMIRNLTAIKKCPKHMTFLWDLWDNNKEVVIEAGELTPAQVTDIEAYMVATKPAMQPIVTLAVEDEDNLAEGDVVTASVVVPRRDHVAAALLDTVKSAIEEKDISLLQKETVDQKAQSYRTSENELNLKTQPSGIGNAHCPFFPLEKREEWYVLIVDKDSASVLHWTKKITPIRAFEVHLKYILQKSGNHNIRVYVWNDTFLGMDLELDTSYKVLAKDAIKKEIFVHSEDLELDNQMTIYQQMLAGFDDEDGSSADEEVFQVDSKTGTMVYDRTCREKQSSSRQCSGSNSPMGTAKDKDSQILNDTTKNTVNETEKKSI